jgi:ComF family protein
VRVLRSTAAGTVHSLTSVVFPADCRVCGLPLSGFSLLPVCDSCWNDLPPQNGPLCTRCGEALPAAPSSGPSECRLCRAAIPPFEKAVAHGVYAGKLKTLVHLLKYDGMEPLAKRLGVLAAERLLAVANLPDALVVIPVPLWAPKRRQRGFNQSDALARGAIAAMLSRRPAMRLQLAAGVLARQRATESQAGLSPHQRRINVRGAFFVSKPAAVDGRNVLLIDDIYTTGATARACAQALRSAGAARVWVATVARAQREGGLLQQDGAQPSESPALDAPAIPMEQDVAIWDRPPI